MAADNIMLAPLSSLYGAIMRARLALYRCGALSVQQIKAPVISIGNITAGGTGKTPHVEWLARHLAQEGHRVCILTRGYGRERAKQRVVVSNGTSILADARTGGDEPRMLAESLQGIAAVISDADRASAARWAIENLGSTVFVLDDGFQHLGLARSLDIVTLDATNPFGGGHLLPRGLLREPPSGLKRADCIIITRADEAANLQALIQQVARLSGDRPIFISHTHTKNVRPLFGNALTDRIASIMKQPVAAFCATGNPRSFFHHAQSEGFKLAHTRAFTDHHFYTQSDIATLEREAQVADAQALLTTAKDAVKLRALSFTLPCYVLEIEVWLENEEGLISLIKEALNK